MVNGGINKAGVHMHTEFADGNDAKRIAKNAKRYDSQGKQGAFPRRAKEELAGDEAGDEEDERGTDAAAFGSHLETEARELKLNAVPEQRGAGEAEQQFRGIGRAMLQERFDGVFNNNRERHQKDEKRERERERAKGAFPEAKKGCGEKEKDKGQGCPCEGIDWGEFQAGTKAEKIAREQQKARGETEGGEKRWNS
jgi:hypothetical protein